MGPRPDIWELGYVMMSVVYHFIRLSPYACGMLYISIYQTLELSVKKIIMGMRCRHTCVLDLSPSRMPVFLPLFGHAYIHIYIYTHFYQFSEHNTFGKDAVSADNRYHEESPEESCLKLGTKKAIFIPILTCTVAFICYFYSFMAFVLAIQHRIFPNLYAYFPIQVH